MEEYKQLAIAALQAQRSDDYARVRRCFQGYTADQMQEQYANTGLTRQAVLEQYEKRQEQYHKAIAWIRSANSRSES
jgi:hypothetical protein